MRVQITEAERLLSEVQELLDTARERKLLRLVDERWPEVQARAACREDAETCRLAMIAAYQLAEEEAAKLPKNDRREARRIDRYHSAAVWRVRSLARAAGCGWIDGVMAIVMSEALRLQSGANGNEYRPGDDGYVVREEAFAILAEMEPYVGSATSEGIYKPCPSFTGRQLHEKRAFLEATRGRWAEAVDGYERALKYVASDRRGLVKVALNLSQAQYLRTQDAARRGEEAERTFELAGRAAEERQHEIAQKAFENARRMEAGDDRLLIYEVL
jgi:hypothetical protein